MAIDTANKRSSAINVSLPWRGKLPLPDGAVTAPDRLHVGLMYSGIAAGGVTFLAALASSSNVVLIAGQT